MRAKAGNTSGKIKDDMTDKALKIVDQIVRDIPEKEKQSLIDSMISDSKARDHFLKILLWTYCGNEIKRDLSKKAGVRRVIDKWDRKKHVSEKRAKGA